MSGLGFTGGQAFRPLPYVSGRYYVPDGSFVAGNGVGSVTANARLMPGFIRDTVTVSSLSVRISTLAAAGNFQIAIYASDPVTLLPTGAPVYSSGNQSTAATGLIEITGLSVALPRGLYWFAVNGDANGGAAAYVSRNSNGPFALQLVGSPTTTNILSPANNITGYNKATAFNTWPTLTGSVAGDSLVEENNLRGALVAFKIA